MTKKEFVDLYAAKAKFETKAEAERKLSSKQEKHLQIKQQNRNKEIQCKFLINRELAFLM